jgi:hypothetical protein
MANKEQFEYNRKSKKELKEICTFYGQQYKNIKHMETYLNDLSYRFDNQN